MILSPPPPFNPVLRQLRVTLEDAVLRLEQLPEGGRAGAALEIRMERWGGNGGMGVNGGNGGQ